MIEPIVNRARDEMKMIHIIGCHLVVETRMKIRTDIRTDSLSPLTATPR